MEPRKEAVDPQGVKGGRSGKTTPSGLANISDTIEAATQPTGLDSLVAPVRFAGIAAPIYVTQT